MDGFVRVGTAYPRQALALQQAGAVILDVRDDDEVRRARIPGSLHIPMDRLAARIAEVPTDRPVIVQCATGSRSNTVARYLARLGYKDVHNLQGGLMGWHFQGLPVET